MTGGKKRMPHYTRTRDPERLAKTAAGAGPRAVVPPSVYREHEDFSEARIVARDLEHAADGGALTIEGLEATADAL